MGASQIPAATGSGGSTGDKWVLISSVVPSGQTAINFTSISGYRKLMLAFSNVAPSAAQQFYLRFNSDSGANYNPFFNNQGTSISDPLSYGSSFITCGSGSTTGGRNGLIFIDSVDSTTAKAFSGYIVNRSGGYFRNHLPGSFYYTNSAITSVNILFASGATITGDYISLYGVAA